MATHLAPGSATITRGHHPHVSTPTVNLATGRASFQGSSITATGAARLAGHAGDSPAGWELGFVQAQWIETNWVSYLGRHDSDGSLFLQRGRPPARPAQGCRDTVGAVGAIWYNAADNGTTGSLHAPLSARFYDKPGDDCALVERNGRTGKDNYLSEAQFEFHFCTVLVLRDPGGVFHQLCSFYWNVHWQASFHPSHFTPAGPTHWSIRPVRNGNSSAVSHVIQGSVTDHRFRNLITGPATQNCNAIFAAAERSVEPPAGGGRHESAHWHEFNVGR